MTDSQSPQLPLDTRQYPKPTGNIWEPSVTHPATVPVPLPIVVVNIDGPYTALDRKLWLLLLHHAWDDLGSDKPYHEISVGKVLRLFRQFGRGDLGKRGMVKFLKTPEETEAAALWDSVRRLVKTSIDWEDEEYQGITNLISGALTQKKYRDVGKIYYAFDKAFAEKILAPRSFARLHCHVVMALKSKYAVTLYEILEAYVNRRDNCFTVSIDDFRSWLKVPEGAYSEWKDLKRNVVLPAVNEMNQHSDEAGFIVSYEGIREGKSFTKISFALCKTSARDNRDATLQGKARRKKAFKPTAQLPFGALYAPTDEVLAQLAIIASGWDRQALLAQYREWTKDKPPAKNSHGAFIGWVKKFTKGQAAA